MHKMEGLMMANSKQKKGNNMVGLLLICAVAIIVLLVVVIVLLAKGNDSASTIEEGNAKKRNVVVTQDNVEQAVEEMVKAGQEFVEPGNYIVNMETKWHFATGDAISDNARVDNHALNTNDVYFDVFLLEDESEPIYESPVIPIGGFLENIALDTPLDAGEHDCVIVYHLINENQETLSTLRVAFTITVDA